MILFSENIALNKRATQIGTCRGQGPEHANDGNLTQKYEEACSMPNGHCYGVSPADRGQPAWWSVYLASNDPKQRFTIKSVIIYSPDYGTYAI